MTSNWKDNKENQYAPPPPGAAPPVLSTPGNADVPPPPPLLDDDEEEESPLPPRAGDEEELDMTPMVDVTFLLLIFFMVTASFSVQKAIASPAAESDAPSINTTDDEQEKMDQVEVRVNDSNFFEIQANSLYMEPTPSKSKLIIKLKEARDVIGGDAELKVIVHKDAKLQALVDAMDSGNEAQFTEIKVTQVDEMPD
ncbi:MAG: biopolymer transporter ExbD [Planctomycetota bacterium]